MKSIVLLTPGHCASSLAMKRIGELGYDIGPPGDVDGRHPQGHYDWMELIRPQILGDWGAYVEAVRARERDFAFKLQTGAIRWGARAIEVLPNPKIVILDRAEWAAVAPRVAPRLPEGAQWLWEWSRAAMRIAADYPVEFWTKEDLCGAV